MHFTNRTAFLLLFRSIVVVVIYGNNVTKNVTSTAQFTLERS